MVTVMTTDETRRGDNKRRAARMNVWIDLARKTSDDDDCAHVRFVFYWIAYEAAYKVEDSDSPDAPEGKRREAFHLQATWHDAIGLQEILSQHRESIVKLLELRQAHRSFWYRSKQQATSVAEWNRKFQSRVRDAVRRLDNRETASTLDDIFSNLAVVRNQIVHGASAGSHSRGSTQVRLGAQLLHDLIPCFRDSIASNLDEDWGQPPFPRVGAGPDDECPPPWLTPASP